MTVKKLIRGDADLATIAHYISRGQRLEDLVNATPLELKFYRIAWELELEYIKEALSSGEQKR